MAETVHLFLKANGNDIDGESTQHSLDREGSIECLSYEHNLITARESGSGKATGRRQYEPLTIRKRVDKASPLLLRALVKNEAIAGTFKFYRPHGDGTTKNFYEVEIEDGYIASIKQVSPDCFNPAFSTSPPLEEITFVFNAIRWTHNESGRQHYDSWKEPA